MNERMDSEPADPGKTEETAAKQAASSENGREATGGRASVLDGAEPVTEEDAGFRRQRPDPLLDSPPEADIYAGEGAASDSPAAEESVPEGSGATTEYELPESDGLAPDSLVESLVLIARTHGLQLTRDAAMSGLPTPDGRLTPALFERAARRVGLSARIVRRDPRQLRDDLLPAVLLLEGREACVLVGWNDDKSAAYVVYPELKDTRVEVPWLKLKAMYAGAGIYVRPAFRTDARSPEVDKRSGRHWFWGVIAENRGLYRDVLVAAVLVNLFALAMPLFIRNVYDRVVPNHAMETLFMFAAGVVIVIFADLLLRNMRSFFVDKAAARADVRLSAMIMERVMGMRMEDYPPSVGAFASRLGSFESVRSFISSATVLAFVDLPFALLFIGLIALIAWPLAIPVAIGAGLLLVFVIFVHPRLRHLAESVYRAKAQRNSTLVESLSAAETIKTLGAEGRVQAVWEKASAHLAEQNTRNRFLTALVSNGATWVQRLVGVAVIVGGVYLIRAGSLSTGALIMAYLISLRAMAPIGQIAGLLVHYHQASTALKALNKLMAQDVERPLGQTFLSRPRLQGGVDFRNVSFTYPKRRSPAISDVSFKISAGEHVGILGRVGTGKTTLAKLILGLYRPTEGAVMIDGFDLQQLDPAELRRGIGYVSQDVTLFYGSLRENIVLGSPLADDEAVLKAIAVSGLEDLINGDPEGAEMQVGERGVRLSGGQRQSVGIARAVIHEPPILLMDEPTSAMDRSTERKVRRNIAEFAQGRTTIVITHRTSLLELVDRIIVLENGKVVADGPKKPVLEAMRKGRIGKSQS